MTARQKLRKDAREIVKWAEARGWRLDPHPNGMQHWVLRYPRTGARMTIPGTSSDRRNAQNAMSKMKRLERGEDR